MKPKFLVALMLIVAMLGSSALLFSGCDNADTPESEQTYTVTFDSLGGSAVEDITVISGKKVDAPEVPIKKGYTLTGWYTSKTEMTINTLWAFLGYTVTSDLTLYAGWMPNIYTVEYDGNGGTGTSIPMPAVYDENFEILVNLFTRSGYDFSGWNTKSNGTGASYSSGQSIKNLTDKSGENIKLYAQWTGKKYTVTLDKQSGMGGSSTVTATYNSAMPSAATPIKSGYKFLGYYDQKSGGTQYYTLNMASARAWNKTENTTLYAQWEKYPSVSAGDHSHAIDASGNLWAWGWNASGALGDGTDADKTSPVQIKTDTKFAEVSAGSYHHSLGIDTDGNLWAWGDNYYGQLGDGTKTHKSSPARIKYGTKFAEVSAGYSNSLAVDTDGNLWAWGNNYNGQLGDGTTTDKTSPVKILLS